MLPESTPPAVGLCLGTDNMYRRQSRTLPNRGGSVFVMDMLAVNAVDPRDFLMSTLCVMAQDSNLCLVFVSTPGREP